MDNIEWTSADQDRYDAFLVLHADELRRKAEAAVAVSVECMICSEPLAMDSILPWLVCKNNHKTRPWTDAEIEAMDNAISLELRKDQANAQILGAQTETQ